MTPFLQKYEGIINFLPCLEVTVPNEKPAASTEGQTSVWPVQKTIPVIPSHESETPANGWEEFPQTG